MRVKLSFVAVAFLGYELLAYWVNRGVWQQATATGDFSGLMPFDFLGQMIGYGPSMLSPSAPVTTGTTPVSLATPPPRFRLPLPVFRPLPMPPPDPTMPPDILNATGGLPPFATWPSGA